MMKAREFVTVAVVCGCWSILALLGAGTATGAVGDVLAGDDLFRTVPGMGSYYDVPFDAIPENYFGPGSEPFEGIIYLMGEPISPTPLGPTDTIVERASDASFSGNPLGATVDVEIVELSLVSIEPITVDFDGGLGTVDYNLSISLNPNVTFGGGPSTGQMTLYRNTLNDDGGNISSDSTDSFFDVYVELFFDKIGTGGYGSPTAGGLHVRHNRSGRRRALEPYRTGWRLDNRQHEQLFPGRHTGQSRCATRIAAVRRQQFAPSDGFDSRAGHDGPDGLRHRRGVAQAKARGVNESARSPNDGC